MDWIRVSAALVFLIVAGPAVAFGPSMGLDADIGQLAAAGYGGDAATNAPHAGGDFTDLTVSRFTPAPSGAGPHRPSRRPRVFISP
jgi:hypothetical protein